MRQYKFKNEELNEVYPNKGESKKDFVTRFMSVTKDEYPDIKQRYAVANSYWERRHNKSESLTEATRGQLISKSRKGDTYKKSEDNRWVKKTDCNIANTVKDYNKIDMNTFWKQDSLTFGVKVEGKTNTYTVYVSFDNILNRLQKEVKANKNKLTSDVIYKALLDSMNTEDVKINCSCPDYQYRLKYYASKNGFNQGKAETRPSKITNPDDTKGAACKHVLAVINNLEWLKKIASVINNYVNYYKDSMQYNYGKFIFPKIYGIPYEKAVQLAIDDYDDKGELKSNLASDEALINLSNALGKVRGRFKKKENE